MTTVNAVMSGSLNNALAILGSVRFLTHRRVVRRLAGVGVFLALLSGLKGLWVI